MMLFEKVMRRIQSISGKRQSGPTILMYHRVASHDPDPWNLCVSPQNFRQQMEVLRDVAVPVSLTRMVEGMSNGDLDPRSVAVTFDDGYVDNLRVAKPVLEEFSIPATVFVVSGYVDEHREFWWDDLERILFAPENLPDTLQVETSTVTHYVKLGNATYRERLRAYYALWEALRGEKDEDRRDILDALGDSCSDDGSYRDELRPMTAEELEQLSAGGLVEIGAHTLTHPSLAGMPSDDQHREVQQGKALLEKITGRRITGFSYPHGSHDDTSVEEARLAGFSHACTTVPEVVGCTSDALRMPRVQVPDSAGRLFGLWLEYRL